MEDAHVERVFKVLYMLQSIRYYSVTEIAQSLDVNRRTVYRYIDNLRSSGFEIQQEKGCPRLVTDSRQNRGVLSVISGTSEWRIMKNVEAFEEAIQLGRYARLNGYASGHSDTVKDRIVEPFEITKNKKYVWCYDPESKCCKVFRPTRCKSVDTLGRPWKHQSEFKSEMIDIFGFHGTSPIHLQIKLDVMAHNLLLEENAEAALDMKKFDKEHWLLDTRVYEIYGAGRFFMGLIGHFEIINAPELQNYMAEKCGEIKL